MLRSAEISVVVQGPILPNRWAACRENLRNLRALLPEAELIISTWEGTVVDGLPADRVVFSPDPGAEAINVPAITSKLNNLNRQILSTRAGLDAATRRMAIKLRTDSGLTSQALLEWMARERECGEECRLFQERILVSNVHTRRPEVLPFLFHVSDVFQAGLSEDLRYFWAAPLVKEPEFTRWFAKRRKPAVEVFPAGGYLYRCAPEQYLTTSACLRGGYPVQLEHSADMSLSFYRLHRKVLASNFIVARPSEIGLQLPEHLAASEDGGDLYTFAQWQALRVRCSNRFSQYCREVAEYVWVKLNAQRFTCAGWWIRRSAWLQFVRRLRSKYEGVT